MFAAPELRVELHGHPARSGRLLRSRNQAARPRPILQAQGTPRKPRLHGIVSTSRDLRNSAPADGRDSGRRRRHYFRGTLSSRRNSESRPTGFLIQHPWVNNQLERVLARWAFKVCTAGGFEMPAFTLADDGYLFMPAGQVYSGSDWVPQDRSVNSLATGRGLVVRYPVRTKEDLLPYTKITTSELRQLLVREFERQGCPAVDTLTARIATEQIELQGTFVLHSKTAAKNG